MSMRNLLDIRMERNDAGAETIGEYMVSLLRTLFEEGEGFSGKRPFGNSSWESEVAHPLVREGIISGEIDEDGYLEEYSYSEYMCIIPEILDALYKKDE